TSRLLRPKLQTKKSFRSLRSRSRSQSSRLQSNPARTARVTSLQIRIRPAMRPLARTTIWTTFLSRSCERRSRRRGLGGELGQFVDAQLLFDLGDLLDVLLKSIVAEQAVLFFLELLSQFLDPVGRDDLAKCWKEHGVFPRLVRPIHPDELPHGDDQLLLAVGLVEPIVARKPNHDVRADATRLMLGAERLRQLG